MTFISSVRITEKRHNGAGWRSWPSKQMSLQPPLERVPWQAAVTQCWWQTVPHCGPVEGLHDLLKTELTGDALSQHGLPACNCCCHRGIKSITQVTVLDWIPQKLAYTEAPRRRKLPPRTSSPCRLRISPVPHLKKRGYAYAFKIVKSQCLEINLRLYPCGFVADSSPFTSFSSALSSATMSISLLISSLSMSSSVVDCPLTITNTATPQNAKTDKFITIRFRPDFACKLCHRFVACKEAVPHTPLYWQTSA